MKKIFVLITVAAGMLSVACNKPAEAVAEGDENAPAVEAQAPQAPTQGSISSEQMVIALKQCSAYIWGNSAYSIAFCVCRDAFNMGDNASQYERVLCNQGIMLPAGTINTAMNRNQWMKYPIDRWEENGASGRALKLRNAFIKQMDKEMASLDLRVKNTKTFAEAMRKAKALIDAKEQERAKLAKYEEMYANLSDRIEVLSK